MQHAAEISAGDGADSKLERALKQRDYFLQQTTAGELVFILLYDTLSCEIRSDLLFNFIAIHAFYFVDRSLGPSRLVWTMEYLQLMH